MPDGAIVRFPDDMPPDQIRALIVEKFPDLAPTPGNAPSGEVYDQLLENGSKRSKKWASGSQPPAVFGEGGRAFQTGVMQGLTGNFLDEINAGLMTPIEVGIDAFQGRPIDVGAAYKRAYDWNRDTSQNAMEAFPTAATVGNVTGALITGGQLAKGGASLMAGAKPTIASMAGRGALEGTLYGGVYGLGEGEDLLDRAQRGAVGAGMGGVLGGVTGAVAGGIAQKANPKAAIPEIDELYAVKDAAYKAVDDMGARYKPEAVDDLLTDIIKRAAKDNISPTRHEKAYSLLVDLENRRGSMSLTQLDQLRQEIRRDLVSVKDGGEAHFGKLMIDAIDDFIENGKPGQMIAGDAQQAAQAITTARKANATLRKSEIIQDAIERAQRRVAATGSGGNIDNAIRQELNRILGNANLSRGFTKAEKALMLSVVNGSGGKGQGLLRLIGKLSPSGNGLMAALGLGSTVANPAMAIAPAAGLIAKTLSDNATKAGIQGLSNAVRTGGAATIPGAGTALGMSLMGATMPAQGMIAPKLPEYLGGLLSPQNR